MDRDLPCTYPNRPVTYRQMLPFRSYSMVRLIPWSFPDDFLGRKFAVLPVNPSKTIDNVRLHIGFTSVLTYSSISASAFRVH